MAPSPAAGKQPPKLPSTPTKAGKSPASSSTSKLNQASGSTDQAKDTTKSATGTPKSTAKSATDKAKSATPSKATGSPKLPPRPKAGDDAASKAKSATPDASKKAEDVKGKAEDTKDEAGGGIGLQDNDPGEAADDEDTDVPQGKVSQGGNETGAEDESGLDEAAPEPVQDDDDEDTVGGAKESAEDTAGDTAGDIDTPDAPDTEDAEDTAAGATNGATGAATGLAGKAAGGAKKGAGRAAKGNATGAAQGAADDAQETAGETAEKAGDAAEGAEDAVEGAEDAAEGAKDTAEGATDHAGETADGAVPEEAEDTAGGAKDVAAGAADEGGETVEDTADGAAEAADGIPEEAGETADGVAEDAGETAEGVVDEAGEEADGVVGEAGEAADGVADEAGEAAEGIEDAADEADVLDQFPVDINILKGLTVGEGGQILDSEGEPLGQLDEGDPEDLIGQTIGDDGEILDEDGDVIGRCSVIPEKARELAEKAKAEAEEAEQKAQEVQDALPDVGVLEGLEVGEGGEIMGADGTPIGKLVEGDAEELVGQKINEQGEIVNEAGEVVGRAEVVPGEAADKVAETQRQQEEIANILKPDLSILGGRKINKKGNILDDEGEIIGKLTEDSDLTRCVGKTPNEDGEILDSEGNVVGKVEIVSGEAADEAMKELHPELVEKAEAAVAEAQAAAEAATDAKEAADANVPTLSILEGLKVNKKGQVLDEDGEPIGQLSEGEIADCAGKKINANGEVLDKDGNVIGKVELAGKPAEEAAAAADEEAPAEETTELSILDGLKVNKKGEVVNEDGDPIARLSEGELADCAGKKLNANGEVLDKDGNVIGKVEMITQEGEEQPEEDMGPELPPLSILEGLKCNKTGFIVNAEGKPVGKLVEGDAKRLAKLGAECDDQGQFWDGKGKVIGRAETLPQEDDDEEGPFAGLEGLIVVKDGWVEDENQNKVGMITEGDPKKLVGRAVDEDGDVIDKRGNVVGHAERYEEPEEVEPEKADLSILKGLTVNKQGNVIGPDGVPIARVVEGNVKELSGRKCDENGQIWNDQGKVIGRCELIPEDQREAKPEGPFAGLEGLVVVKGGMVEDEEGNTVGQVVEGDPKKLVGRAVDEDGDIIDKYGNVKGHAVPYEEEEAPEIDLSRLEGKVVNKAGNVVDEHGVIFGRIVSGDPATLAGRKVDGKGQIWSDNGQVIGQAELIPGGETIAPEGAFAGWEGLVVGKDGVVQDANGQIVGRLIDGDPKKLLGRKVDEDGDVLDKAGNKIGKAERWEPEEKERVINPMAGRKVNKEGEVRDEEGNVIGRLTAGNLGQCIGKEIDDNGYVVDNDGNKIGECTLLDNIIEEEEEGLTEEELAELKKKQEDAEVAKKISGILRQTLDKIDPILKQITEVCYSLRDHGSMSCADRCAAYRESRPNTERRT